jgi:hypothetical protein
MRHRCEEGVSLMLKLSEDEARGFDAICKSVGVVALMLGAGWTLTQYFLHRVEERQTAGIEARKPFLEKRLQVYNDLIFAASTIAWSDDADEVKKASRQFTILNSGLLFVFEDYSVALAAKTFQSCMEDAKSCDTPNLKAAAHNLALVCRASIGEGFGAFTGPPGKLKAEVR